jgi:hypothetical protein
MRQRGQKMWREATGHLTGSRKPTGKDWARVICLGLGLRVALSLVGPIYYGYTHSPYWRIVVWASACTVIFCWQERSSFRQALSTAPPSIIGRFLLVLAIVVMVAVGFFVSDTLVYLFVRALHVDIAGRYLPADLFGVALFAGGVVWLAIRWYRNRQHEPDPYNANVRQAAKFGWRQTAEVPEDGFGAAFTQRSFRFARGDEEAVLWQKDATITLVRVNAPLNFDDFFKLEEFIRAYPEDTPVVEPIDEGRYIREIDKFAMRHGHYWSFYEACFR